jgi:hypothetical protein
VATQTNKQSSNGGGGSVAKDVIRGVAGVAAIGYAGRAIVKSRNPRVLGVKVPRQLAPQNFDAKKLAKQVSKVAGQVERASEDVRMASAQAGRMAKKLS